MNSIEKKLKKDLDAMTYSHFDVLEAILSYKSFVDPGYVKCPKSIEKMSSILIDCMRNGKHPTLNPTIDDIYDFKNDENTGEDAVKAYIENTGEFNTQKIDNTKNFLEINVPFKMMFVNVSSFVENEEIEIKSAFVQTALFRKEIE